MSATGLLRHCKYKHFILIITQHLRFFFKNDCFFFILVVFTQKKAVMKMYFVYSKNSDIICYPDYGDTLSFRR